MPDMQRDDNINLTFPINAAYVSSARLTASSIANRMNFDIDEIEDIKTAVSESCTYIIKTLPAAEQGNFFEIMFHLKSNEMSIKIKAHGKPEHSLEDGEMSMKVVKALVDELDITVNDEDGIIINILKTHKDSIFS